MKYFVYFNLHKKLFSVRNQKTRLVEKHSSTVVLVDVWFKVSQKGREKVLREQKKNVHAGVEGVICGFEINEIGNDFIELTYNPYLYDSFVVKNTEKKVAAAGVVVLKNKKIFAKQIIYL